MAFEPEYDIGEATSSHPSTHASSNLSSAVIIGTLRNMEGCNTHLPLADGNHSFLLSSRACVGWERDSIQYPI